MAFSVEKFIKELNESYPEKTMILMEIEYNNLALYKYITDNLLSTFTFDPLKFKDYIKNLNIGISTDNLSSILSVAKGDIPSLPDVGQMIFDTSTQTLKFYDGNEWLTITSDNL
jgi:hypothetical protein